MGTGSGRGDHTLHFEVLVAFGTAETEFFGVVADKHDPVPGIYRPRAVSQSVISPSAWFNSLDICMYR